LSTNFFSKEKKNWIFLAKDMIIILLKYLTKLCERQNKYRINFLTKVFVFSSGRLYREGAGREGKGIRERERERKKSGAVPAALQFCCMPTQRWRWRPWRVLRQATGAVRMSHLTQATSFPACSSSIGASTFFPLLLISPDLQSQIFMISQLLFLLLLLLLTDHPPVFSQ
jgi:hypothetical protein